MKYCITKLIINLFSPDELLVIFIFILYMYMFIEDIKLFDVEFGIYFGDIIFIFLENEARVIFLKVLSQNWTSKALNFLFIIIISFGFLYILDTAWCDVKIAYHFSLCENNTFDISIVKITACENIILMKWIKPVISQLKM